MVLSQKNASINPSQTLMNLHYILHENLINKILISFNILVFKIFIMFIFMIMCMYITLSISIIGCMYML